MTYARNSVLLAIVNILVVLAVGIGLLSVSLKNADLLRKTVDAQTRAACNSAGFKVYPDALANPESLSKLLLYNEKCHALNGVKDNTAVLLP